MANITALAALLQLLHASGGSVVNRIRIQKEAYLLATRGVSAFRLQSFSYHHYGPFSRELSDTLQFAVSAGLLDEIREAFSENSQRYRYELTETGRSFVAESSPLLQNFTAVIARLGGEHWRSLELASTVDFLLRTHVSGSKDEAFSKALQLKPDTVPYRSQAETLLAYLSPSY